MSLATTLMAYVRKNAVLSLAEGQEQGQLTLNPRGELLMAQALPPLTELVRQGCVFGKLTDAAASIATALPTVAAKHTLWNGSTTASVIILDVTWYTVVSAGAASGFGIMGCVHPLPVTSQPATADTLTKVSSLNGKIYGGMTTTSNTVTVPDDGWFPLPVAPFTPGSTETGGVTLYADLQGVVIIPPLCRFSLSGTSVGTTVTGNMFIRFCEAVIPNLST